MNTQTDLQLFSKLLGDDEQAFSELFHRYYSVLCAFVFRYLGDEAATEELVQELFVRMWEKRKQLTIQTSVKSYLYRAVKNELINRKNHEKVEQKYRKLLQQDEIELGAEQVLPEPGLMRKIEASIESLPPKRKEIFRLSREKGLSYREIAEQLGISVKTVEAQMGQALKQLREDLKDYRHVVIGWSLLEKKIRKQ
ncbi:MAG: RNA polymerase sigma-70 factor [Mangrovibacterium sp.]